MSVFLEGPLPITEATGQRIAVALERIAAAAEFVIKDWSEVLEERKSGDSIRIREGGPQ